MTPDDLKRAGVRVRKLEWKNVTKPKHVEATVAFGKYVVIEHAWFVPIHPVTHVEDTFENAKAAAQQDYENRILSALEPIHEPL